MKRIALTIFVLVLGSIIAIMRPETISVTSVLVIALVAMVALVASLVAMPITKYITVEKWKEVAVANSFRYGINHFRDVVATYILDDGAKVTGVLVARSDAFGTYTIELPDGKTVVIPQAKLRMVEMEPGTDVPAAFLTWDDTSPLVPVRDC